MSDAPKILGILNITTDSFSDGGKYIEPDAAIARLHELVAEGADVIDMGAASSHPDAASVPVDVEIARLAPVIAAARASGVEISIDSFSPPVQLYAAQEGVAYLNDIEGFADETIYPQLAASNAKLILMHSVQGRGKADRRSAPEGDIVDHACRFFEARLERLLQAGIRRERVILDPGMGFFLGSAPEPSLAMLAGLGRIKARFCLPLLVSVSRKSFLRALTGRKPGETGAATLAAEIMAVLNGADFIRTHEPAMLRDALKVLVSLKDLARIR
jgi:dihydropteroate synthase type 2